MSKYFNLDLKKKYIFVAYKSLNTKIDIKMKKSLLTIAMIASSMLVKSQILSYVGEGAVVTIKENTLVYSGGGLKVVGTGKVENYGNVMLVGAKTGTADQFVTENTDGTEKTTGGNFILKMSNPSSYATSIYGQLYIENILQQDIKATVDKEYKATKNGTMQQMALPFYNKAYSSLGVELGNTSGFATSGRNNNAIGYWEDRRVVMHNISSNLTTLGKAPADNQTILLNNAVRYYAIGTSNWNPESSAILYYTVKGKPYSDNYGSQSTPLPLSVPLKNAGYIGNAVNANGNATDPIPYGVGTGSNNNGIYNELYNTYLQDAFDIPSQGRYNATVGAETGTFARNLYQFGNPFLTNIDLSRIGYNEGANGDGNAINSIQGVRYESIGVSTSSATGTHATSYKFITYDPSGVPAGDFSGAIIKPMQAFVIKLRNNTLPQTLNFNTLRRFAYTPRAAATPYSVTAAKNTLSGTLKQLGVIGLDANGEEVARTYFVVSPNATTGHSLSAKLQASAFSGSLSTREELPGGGEDVVASSTYWLYINEANQNDFVGKKVKMVKGASVVKYKFELAEDAVFLADGVSSFVDGGKSFYLEETPGNFVQISNNQVFNATVAESGLYYGLPNSGTLGAIDNIVKDDALEIAFEKNSDAFYVIFPKSWKSSATVVVYDMAGRVISKDDKVSTSKNYQLPVKEKSGYLVEVISDKGQKFSKKIVK